MIKFLAAAALAALSASAVCAAEQPKPAHPDDQNEKLSCRREVPIGSLIATRKVCLTKGDWEKRAVEGNDEARRLYDRGGRCNGVGTAC